MLKLEFECLSEAKMENYERKLLSVKDVIIIASIIGAIFAVYMLFPESGGERAVISCGGSVIADIPLNVSGEYTCPEAPDMIFSVENGAVFVTASGCGDKTCMRTGKISKKGEAIICVPNKVVVEIKGNSIESDVDAVI